MTSKHTAASMLRQYIDKATFPTSMDKHSALQWIDELTSSTPPQCLHQIAEPASNLTRELADMLERSITGLGHYRNTEPWSEADEEHIKECNALLERFNSSDDEHEAAPQAVQAAEEMRVCNSEECGWIGPLSETYGYKNSPATLCPECKETTELSAPAHPAEGEPHGQ